mmetsp:Transcript_46181/g.130580  ORF Transcript_46181/g.130580 Transcript_46181/m.130580 type:complete len:252 (-) Transcript_46181:191-946(-)
MTDATFSFRICCANHPWMGWPFSCREKSMILTTCVPDRTPRISSSCAWKSEDGRVDTHSRRTSPSMCLGSCTAIDFATTFTLQRSCSHRGMTTSGDACTLGVHVGHVPSVLLAGGSFGTAVVLSAAPPLLASALAFVPPTGFVAGSSVHHTCPQASSQFAIDMPQNTPKAARLSSGHVPQAVAFDAIQQNPSFGSMLRISSGIAIGADVVAVAVAASSSCSAHAAGPAMNPHLPRRRTAQASSRWQDLAAG